MESKLQVSDKGDLLDFSLDGGIATQGTYGVRLSDALIYHVTEPPQTNLKLGFSTTIDNFVMSVPAVSGRQAFAAAVCLSSLSALACRHDEAEHQKTVSETVSDITLLCFYFRSQWYSFLCRVLWKCFRLVAMNALLIEIKSRFDMKQLLSRRDDQTAIFIQTVRPFDTHDTTPHDHDKQLYRIQTWFMGVSPPSDLFVWVGGFTEGTKGALR